MWPMIPRSFSVFASILRIKRLNYYFLPQLINHGVPESLMEKVIRMTHQFHNMTSEEKTEFADNDISSSIRWGTSFNPKVESVHYWRDYLKVKTHQDFAFPHKPTGFNLQVNHDGKWVNIYTIPKSLFANVADQLEVVTNGRYKSVLHRAVLNNKATRIPVALIHAPEFDKVISPAQELLENEEPVYKSMTYAEYYFLHQSTILEGKNKLASIRIKPQE
ncbi:hypothetical protein L6164_013193 [Bauhinia variegata]|uniref:Uncharacterized protein n=1 Tax=Bauhinia variegata TaxID=167791 RepID=A0ACB9PDU1_BAUVA|nr:hypothetical protein L6164_013193 [Bauhinia variegata]